MERYGEENIFIVVIQEPRQFPPQAPLVAVTERKESIVVSGIIIKGSPATVHWSELTVWPHPTRDRGRQYNPTMCPEGGEMQIFVECYWWLPQRRDRCSVFQKAEKLTIILYLSSKTKWWSYGLLSKLETGFNLLPPFQAESANFYTVCEACIGSSELQLVIRGTLTFHLTQGLVQRP